MSEPLRLVVNGEQRSLEVDDRTLLVHALRDGLGLTGAHIGCDTSQCGACTVLVDGRAVKSCTVLARQAEDREITTIEGLAPDGDLHPLQQAFVEHHGLQCGFCTPGVILTAADLLSRDASPSDDAIRHALRGNLCRCTGYQGIVESIRAVRSRLVIPAATRYARATDLDHALELLGEPDAKAIAGGQSLIPVMKLRIARPSLVVDISRLELRGIEERDGELHIGPLTTWAELAERRAAGAASRRSPSARAGSATCRYATSGRSAAVVVHADPASDMPAVVARARSSPRGPVPRRGAGPRRSPTCSSARSRPPRPAGARDRRRRADPVAGLRAPRTRRSSILHRASRSSARPRSSGPEDETVALTGVGATPFVLTAIRASAIATAEIFGDRFASEEYRRELAAVVAERALASARERAGRSR